MQRRLPAILGFVALVSGCAVHAAHAVPLVPAASERGGVAAPDPPQQANYCHVHPERDRDRCFVPEDAVVRLVGPEMTCSGTLIDDDLVLTAVHCLVKRGPHGEFTREPLSPTDLTIELGGDYLPWGQVGVASIVSPTSAEDGLLCGEQGGEGDIAVLILPRKLVGVGVMVPSENPPAMKEVLEPIGFGHCAFTSASTTGSAEPSNETTRWSDGFAIRRRQRQGGAVNGTTSATFEMPASICPGDSGGPVHAAGSREIVGVVSLSAMDADTKTMNRSVMVRVDTYRPLIDRARHIADGTPPSELPPVACAR